MYVNNLTVGRVLTLGKHFQRIVLTAELVQDSPAMDTQSSSGTAGTFLQQMT